ncbi:MFS transporter [Caballeronia sp. LZ016]|uniref:MFS transporter n=1 Tax=Caballeronia sp. LZ016 TaxID=3038554 RepID=UPI00285927FB|nr:MFS transporter [Caballeronia sp. LZ016]MDR5740096.1 MFS transporter [Caballeronia sp. LZ016]
MLIAAMMVLLANTDRVGSWKVITSCLVLTGLVVIPQAFVAKWWHLASLRFLMGMSLAGLPPSAFNWESLPPRSAGTFHRPHAWVLQSAQFFGQVVGPLVGGVIGVHPGLRAVFFSSGALLFLCSALAIAASRPHRSAMRDAAMCG